MILSCSPPFISRDNCSALFGKKKITPFGYNGFSNFTVRFLHVTLFCRCSRGSWNVDWRSEITFSPSILSSNPQQSCFFLLFSSIHGSSLKDNGANRCAHLLDVPSYYILCPCVLRRSCTRLWYVTYLFIATNHSESDSRLLLFRNVYPSKWHLLTKFYLVCHTSISYLSTIA